MPTRKTRRSRSKSKQSGGLRYRYTNNARRRTWVDTLYPYGSQLASIIATIPFESWSFQGKSRVAIGEGKNTRLIDTDVNVHLATPAYHMFGGCVTEIFARSYRSSDFPKLSTYVDPTSDVDARISPFIVTTADQSLVGRQVWDAPHTRHFIDWLMNQLKLALKPFAAAMDKAPFRKMNSEENSETRNSTYSEHLGNILISETPFSGYTKIQVGVGIAGGPASHFLEFVINHNKHLPINQIFTPNFAKVGNVYTLNMIDHIYEQLGALADRHRQAGVPRNKVYNHYGRVHYMLKLMAHLVETGQMHPLSPALLGDAEAALYSDIFYEEPYPCPTKCDIKELRHLMEVISNMNTPAENNNNDLFDGLKSNSD